MATNLVPLLIAARRILGVSQGRLGELLGSSRHTGQRWESSGSTPMPSQLHDLAQRVYSSDPELAAQLAVAGGSTLEALGIVKPAMPPGPPRPVPPVEDVVDALVCVAADAIEVSPKTIRPALRAAFARARRLGLTVEEVERALGGKGSSKER